MYYYYYNDKLYDKFLDIYFLKLSYTEREYFLSNFKDEVLKEEIYKLTDLFNNYPFRHSAIIENTHGFSEKKKITNWQKNYYLSIHRAYQDLLSEKDVNINNSDSSSLINIYKSLSINNSSFIFLVNLTKEVKADTEESDSRATILSDILAYDILINNPEKIEGLKNVESEGISNNMQKLTQEEIKKRVAEQLDKIRSIKG
ncbi:MAG: hypothetical protein FJX89_09080 [Bacteroidetes bacterium]|nr:hypothetical protein [Bacteroidota bacterium]